MSAGGVLDGQLNRIFHALGNTSRRSIIERLSDGDASVTELAEAFPISLRGVLDHVRVLERCGLVRTSKERGVRTCRLNPDALLAAEEWMRRAQWASHRERLGSLPQDWRWRSPPERPEGV